MYYHNTRDGASDMQEDIKPAAADAAVEEDDGCAGGACKI
jgi:ribonucleoside-diphosphate reductase alpha chain